MTFRYEIEVRKLKLDVENGVLQEQSGKSCRMLKKRDLYPNTTFK